MIKLCVFDVDGTLVTRGAREVCPSTITALKQLKKAGIKLAIASGRPPFAMEKAIVEAIDFDYYVCSNGAFVEDSTHRTLHSFCFTAEETQDIIKVFKKTDNALMFQCKDAAHCYHGYKRIASMLQGFLGRLDILVDEREQEQYTQDALPFAAVAKIEDKDLKEMKKKFPQFEFTPFGPCFYDINGPHTKASGIKHICEELNISMDEVACFGDDFNDMAMIQECGYGIAMGNARDEIKAEATYVTSDCDADGIYEACIHFGWLNGDNHD